MVLAPLRLAFLPSLIALPDPKPQFLFINLDARQYRLTKILF
jgi:hypothetical protein